MRGVIKRAVYGKVLIYISRRFNKHLDKILFEGNGDICGNSDLRCAL